MAKQAFKPEWADIFSEVQQAMTEWRREHPKATMLEIELETERQLSRLRARMVADVAQHSAAAFFSDQPPEQRPVCPHCAAPVQPRGAKERGLRVHGNGEVRLEREHATCRDCGQAFFPSG
jgi:hypothetical protein